MAYPEKKRKIIANFAHKHISIRKLEKRTTCKYSKPSTIKHSSSERSTFMRNEIHLVAWQQPRERKMKLYPKTTN